MTSETRGAATATPACEGARPRVRFALLAGCGLVAAVAAAADLLPGNAQQGQEVYQTRCAACHGATLQGGPGGPALIGDAFKAKWFGQGTQALHAYVHDKMPLGAPASLPAEDYADVVAFLTRENGVAAAKAAPAGTVPSPPAAANAAASPKPAKAAPRPFDPAVAAAEERKAATLGRMRAVTDDLLRRPPDGDWLHWRRTYAGEGFSNLTQVNRSNVADLRVAWSWQLAPGNNEITPLVHDGVMFVFSGGRVDALNAATGDLLWQYEGPGQAVVLRNLAVYDNLVFLAAETSVVALDMRTGKPVWKKELAATSAGVHTSGGPLVAKGKVFQGMSFCTSINPVGCFLVALDAKTGNELWRFNTIARPGEPGGDTWNGTPMEKRSGASVWLPASYDPDLDLLYFGTGQTYQTANLMSGSTRAAALFTDSTLAVRPDTGKLIWYYQHMDGDVWDLDWSFERILAPLNVGGAIRKTVTTGGKLGIFDTLDAQTGKYLFSNDVGYQSLVQSIDPVTGAKHVDPAKVPLQGGKLVDLCPGGLGGRNWPATAYNPTSGILYVPYNRTCMRVGYNLGQEGGGASLPDERDAHGNVGGVQAIDLVHHKVLWDRVERSPHASAMLATAGGLIFDGTHDRWFRASDDRTGKVLWQVRLNSTPASYPITYSVDGVQYVAVTTGGGNFVDSIIGQLTPEIVVSAGQPTLWIFRLPDRRADR